MSQPVRVQKSRKAGWKTPENTVYVGRAKATNKYPHGTKYANPYKVEEHMRHLADKVPPPLDRPPIAAGR